jgi:predicted ATPase
VEGLPLAIELAAAQLEKYSPVELLAMLDRHTSFSNPRPQGVAPRHETLLATIDWSYRLLPQREAAVFRLVSAFADSFELEDAVHIAGAVGLDPIDVDVALDAAERLDASAVMVNDHSAFRTDWMPFAGRRESGYGIGGIPYTAAEMTAEKMIVFKR